MADKKVGDTVNLENDILGKYIEKLWGDSSSSMKESSVTTGLINSAAQIRSPSFSLFSSSLTIIISPALSAASASSTLLYWNIL